MGFSQGIMPNKSSWTHGQATVTSAGTAVQLSEDSVPVPDGCQLTVIAKPGNGAGIIYTGKSKAEAEGANKFDGLEAGLAMSLKVNDANLVWVNSDTDGIGVSYYVEQ